MSKMNLSRVNITLWVLLCLGCISVINSDNVNNPNLPKCCPPNTIILDETTCLLGNTTFNATFNCALGAYIIDKDFDKMDDYTVVGRDLYMNSSNSLVEPDSYCIGEMVYENGTLHEVAMLCFQEAGQETSIFIKGILAFISVAFICATLYVYKIIPQLRDTQDKVTMICISCLAVTFTVLGFAQTVPYSFPSPGLCITCAFLIYGFLMAYLAWLNMVIANVLKLVVFPQWKIKERKWYILNHVYAWTIPIVLTIILIACQHVKLEVHPRIGENSCWIDEESQWLYLYIPLTTLITLNLVQFVVIAITLYKYPSNHLSSSKKKVLKHKCQLYFNLFILSGMTWFFELFSYIFREWEVYWFITDAVNALHGALIFLVLIIFRKRVRRELAGKQICWCCRIPPEWKKIDNTEDDGFSDETKYDNINIRSQTDHDESRS